MAVTFKNCTFYYSIPKWAYLALFLFCLCAFENDELIHKLALQAQYRLSSLHSPEPESAKVKKCEIIITDEGFLRYRKTFLNGKQEYYSLNVSNLKAIDYIGSTVSGNLNIYTFEDDVIVQTYNDRRGNVDSMSLQLTIPLRDAEPQDLIELQNNLFELKYLVGRQTNRNLAQP